MVTLGLAQGVGGALATLLSIASGVSYGAAFGTAEGLLALGVGNASGIPDSLFVFALFLGMSGGILTPGTSERSLLWFAWTRFPLLIPETIFQAAARLLSALTGRSTLAWSPVLYHELSCLPHPFLEGQIVAEADSNPALARRVLEACAFAPGQRRIGRRAEATLRARELGRLAKAGDFPAIEELRGTWLPGVQGADSILLAFREAARYLAAAQAAFNPHHKLKHLAAFASQLNAIENQLRSERGLPTETLRGALQALRAAGDQMRAAAQKAAEGLIPNPFRAGNPLSGEEGPELFRGREAAVREIEDILADASHAASLLLLAPRRSGKTSLLKMLPRMAPESIFVFFDLQAHPVASPGAFWSKLAEQAMILAKRDRRVEMPALPPGPPIEAAAAWIEKLDHLPEGRRVLIAIDEFERLEDLFPGSRQEFLQLMGLFRATIQHRRGVRLLVSGVAPFDELDRVWDDHFISARQIRLPFLDEPTSIGLLTAPAPEFPQGTIPDEVAREVYRRTGGQPYLLQVFGSLLVSRLNDEKRQSATMDDVAAVESRVFEWAEGYFRDMYRSAPERARDALADLSQGKPVELSPATRRWLAQRYLLTPDDRLAIPIFGAWIEHYALV
jgi:hypothetical protein